MAITVAVALLYFVAGKLGLHFAFLNASASPIWPPAGIALAALLVFGPRVWPGIFLGAFLVNVTTAGSVATSLAIAAGNTLEGLVGAFLVSRFAAGRHAFERPQDIFRFVALAGLVSTTLSATIGVTSLAFAGHAAWDAYGSIWLTWWLGDVAGAVVVAPVLLLWSADGRLGPLRARPLEAALLLLAVCGVGIVAFGGAVPGTLRNHPLTFLTIPPLLWAAFRFGQREAGTLIAVLSTLAIDGTLRGHGPFALSSPNQALLLLQGFMATMVLTVLSVAALVWERRRATEAIRESQERHRRFAEDVRESEERLRMAVQAGGMGTWEWTMGSGQVQWSPGLAALHGLAPGTLGGTFETFQAVIHPDDRDAVRGAVAAAFERGEYRIEYRIVRLDGVVRWIEGRGEAFFDARGRPERMLGICTDVTDRKQAEHERARLLSVEQTARAEAESANRAKDEFLAMLGHELRNPLGAISNAAQLLKRVGAPDPQSERAREIIERQVRHLGRLVDDLLDVSRVMTGKIALHLEPVDVGDVVRRSVATLHATQGADRHRVTVDVAPVWVRGDPTRLEQVVANLLTNAAKYTPAGGDIRVTLRQEDGRAVLAVRDSGIGIPPELLPRVFDLFVQGERTLERGPGGLGIGLTLVRRLVEFHGGDVAAASEGASRGSAFTVRLPAIASPGDRRPAPPAHAPAGPRRVLVVEDNDDSRETLCQLLRVLGHDVHEAAGGRAAVQRALELKPDLTLIDLGLPEIDGYEVARRIRASPAGGALYLVALTGYGLPEDRDRSREAGFDAHLVKPLDPAALTALLADRAPR